MDQASRSPEESRERAVSSEPCSTRPNPFDDELSARKRRRTSLSGGASPTRSSGGTTGTSGTTGSRTASSSQGLGSNQDLPQPPEDSKMRVDTDLSTPQTPEQQGVDLPHNSPAERVSSRVTINLRTPQRPLDTIPSSPLSSTSPVAAPQEQEVDNENVKISVEESEVEMLSQGDADTNTSTPMSSTLDGGSPPVQVIDVQPEDDSEFVSGSPQVTILRRLQDAVLEDPTPTFPYRIHGEHHSDSVNRVNAHILTFDNVALSLQTWVDQYLDYVKEADYPVLFESFQEHRLMWQGLPEIVQNALCRRSSVRDRNIRHQLADLFLSFARITAHFVGLDCKTLEITIATEDTRLPDLISPAYLHVLSCLCQREETQVYNGHYQDRDEAAELLDQFLLYYRGSPGGSFTQLWKLAQGHVELLSRFPRLNDNLHYISQLASYLLMQDMRSQPQSGSNSLRGAEHTRHRQTLGYEIFKMASNALAQLIDKSITNLSHEHTGCEIRFLGDIFFNSLRTDLPGPSKCAEDFHKLHPHIPECFLADVISSEWRFQTYSKLIMSSQMQLRVMAVTQMSTDLVQCWRRFSEPPQDSRFIIVHQHFAEFLLRTGLVAYILGPTCHPEITIEAGNIVGFLLVTGTYTTEHTDAMWETVTTTQDPRVSEALLRMNSRIANLFTYEGLVYLCQKLQTLPIENFSLTVREFTDQALKALCPKCPLERLETTPYLLLLRLMRESSVLGSKSLVAYPDLREFAFAGFKELLAHGPDSEGRAALYEDCMRDIAEKTPTTLGSIAATLSLMKHFWSRELSMLTTRYSFHELLVNELEHAIAAGRKAGFLPVISMAPNQPRADMICNLVNHQPLAITDNGLGRRLWDMMVGKDAACEQDRESSWKILNACLRRTKPENPYLLTCLSKYLPVLPPECLCGGALDFVRSNITPVVNDPKSDVLDDDESPDRGAIEEIWRMILTTANQPLERAAIEILVCEIYLNSKSIRSFSHHRARKVHLAFVDRCLKQIFSAAERLRSFSDGSSSGDDEAMVVVASDSQVQEQRLLFVRSLAVLREFHRLYSATSHFSAPDLRSLPMALPDGVEGDSAELKFQSFDGEKQTEVKELNIGRRNTAASLLASLKEATGFDNYRIYYQGKAFVPHERDICKSLDDLQIHNGLILVKRESDTPDGPLRIRPGASPVEIEILGHFEKLWDCLSMEDSLASEIWSFLTRLPIDDHILLAIHSDATSPTAIFPVGQTFKSLYAIIAMKEFLAEGRKRQAEGGLGGPEPTDPTEPTEEGQQQQQGEQSTSASTRSYGDDLARVLSLAVAAICSKGVVERCSEMLQIFLCTNVLEVVILIIQGTQSPTSVECLNGNFIRRLVELLSSNAASQPVQTSAKLAGLLFQVLLECALLTVDGWSVFTDVSQGGNLIQSLVLEDSRQVVRMQAREAILLKFKQRGSISAVPTGDIEEFFWSLSSDLIVAAMKMRHYQYQCEEAFFLWIELFKALRKAKSAVVDLQSLVDTTSQLLLHYEAQEDVTRPDLVDIAMLNLSHMLQLVLVQTDEPDGSSLTPRCENLVEKLFWKHLFPPWASHSQALLSKPIITPRTRRYIIEAIIALVSRDARQLSQLLSSLNRLVPCDTDSEDEDPYHYDLPFTFDRLKAIRAPCGYAGLRNLSNTCYLNSLFTQLFMNVGFRAFILGSVVRDGEHSQKLLLNTQTVFGSLQNSIKRFVDPQDCVASIKTYDDCSIDIHSQMDVDEFYNLLFDRLEGQHIMAESKKILRSFYGGQLVQQVKSKECEHVSEILEPFSAIQCDIKGKSSLQESLQAYVDGEIMGGDNKYKCSTCDRHVDAVKRACLKDLPDNLIFHLKRFDFNLRSLTRNKINDYFAFPSRIDMRPYTVGHLGCASDENSPDLFDLVGVLVHSGTAESGHYYSYIRERPTASRGEVWIEFNDDTVQPWDHTQIESSCFGGMDYRGPFDASGQPFERPYSAYMLFYQRASSLAKEQEALMQRAAPSPVQVPMSADLATFIQEENTSLLRRHCLFDESHIVLVNAALDAVRTQDRGQPETGVTHMTRETAEKRALEMALSHLDQVASRAKDIPDFDGLLSHILRWGATSSSSSHAMVTYFHERHAALRMLVQRNPEAHVRAAASDLFIQVLRRVKVASPGKYGDVLLDPQARTMSKAAKVESVFDPRKVMNQAWEVLQVMWDYFHIQLRSWSEVFGLMLSFARLGPLELALFVDNDNLRKLVMMISADTSETLPPQYARMAQTVSRRLATRPPAYENVIALIALVLQRMHQPLLNPELHDHINAIQDQEERARACHWPRLWWACQHPLYPMEMSKSEYQLLCKDWPRGPGNMFVDKLLSLNQNPGATDSIIESLVRLSSTMELKVLSTLLVTISGNIVAHINGPFLRAAVVFCRTSRNRNRVREMFMHVCAQCRTVHNMEGRAFFEFHRDVFDVLELEKRGGSDDGEEDGEGDGDDDDDSDNAPAWPVDGLATLHKWVPGLLAYYEPPVGNDVFEFLHQNLFRYGPGYDGFDEESGGMARSEAHDDAARRLAIECLRYLRDMYVRRDNQVGQHVVTAFHRVLEECHKYFELDVATVSHAVEIQISDYAKLRPILEPLQKLTVEDLEEDASGMLPDDTMSISSTVSDY